MIRKSSFRLSFPNAKKKAEMLSVLTEARRVTNIFIQKAWVEGHNNMKFLNQKTETFFSAKAQQVCSAKALQIVKSVWARKNKTMPKLKAFSFDLDSRFIEFLPLKNSFDFWIKLFGFYPTAHQLTFRIPCQKHRHFNSFITDGWTLKKSGKLRIRDGKLILDVYFEKDEPPKKSKGKEIGVDIGYRTLLATSENQIVGTGFKELAEKIQRKKQGSKAFKKALIERDEFINSGIKQLPWDSTQTFVLEDLKGLKDGKRFRKKFQAKFQRWTYPALVKRLEMTAEISGVHVHKVNPAFTSQTCSRCGSKDKTSRNGEVFSCTVCNWVGDADLNASANILMKFRLPEHLDPVQKVYSE